MSLVVGSIPSPSSGNVGPFHMYGLILAVGVLVAVYVAEQRWRRRAYPKDGIYDISFWVVIWGVIGARLYHVITDYQRFEADPWRAFQIWRAGYTQYATFQPTFLYESLACLAIVGILLLVEQRALLKLGQTFALYVVLYTFARFWFENMRIDPAHEIAGMRVNAWVSVFVFA